MKLVSLYGDALGDIDGKALAANTLYQLLEERDETVNISHRKMPAWDDHVRFIESKPYEAWYLIDDGGEFVGAAYLTKQDEIGVSILKKHQGKRIGKEAVLLLMQAHPKARYLANINPQNKKSISLFAKLGFRHIQNTYEYQHQTKPCKEIT